MTKVIFESKTNRKIVYKTENGIEIKPMLHSKKTNANNSTNITYYYVKYRLKNNNWEILTNKNLYGETKIIDTFDSKEDAIKTANAINKSIHFLIENI
jgi:hypothetical protein